MITAGKKKDTVVCWREISSFFVVAGNFHYDRKKKIHYNRKKKRYSRLSDGCAVLAITTGKKKDTVVCLTGCAVVLFFVVAGNFDYDRKKKEDTVVCWREIGSFFVVAGNFHYNRKKKRFITTGKKKDTVVCLMGARFWRLGPEKKIQSSVWRVVLLYQFLVLAGN